MGPRRDRGASAVEYGLMLAAITAVITAVVFALGPAVRGTFEQGSCALKSQQPQTTSC